MRVLLSSGGIRTPERVEAFSARVRAFFGDIERVVFVPYALADHEEYVRKLLERGLDAGYRIDPLHRHADPAAVVRGAPALFVGGGNTFRLLSDLYHHDLLDVIIRRVRAGMPYLGVSAGTNVACPTMKTTNDMPITEPPSLDALGLVPFQVNPHYFSGSTYVQRDGAYYEHFSETRDDRIREFHEMNDTPVVGLWETGFLWVEDGRVQLLDAPARVFRKSREPVDVAPGARLDELL
jgi:dipeptidase E